MDLFGTISSGFTDADKKPNDFESTEEYINYLEKEMVTDKKEKEKNDKIDAALEIKAIQEKYNVELSENFLRDITNMKKN